MLFYLKVTVLTVLLLLSSGCYGAKETDNISYVIVYGTDTAPGGKLKVTTQIALPNKIGDSGASELQESTDITDTITIPSSAENRTLLASTLSRARIPSHLTALIISDELARTGIAPILEYFIRTREFRETIYIIVVPGKAEDYIKKNKSKLNATLFRFYENFMRGSKKNYSLPSTLHNFYNNLKNRGGSPYAAYSTINAMNDEDKPAGRPSPQEKNHSYIAGDLPRTGTKDPVEFLGLAVFQDDKMVGVLNSNETRAVSLLKGEFDYGYLGIIDPLAPEKEVITFKIYSYSKPKITADFKEDRPVFTVKLTIEMELIGISSGINYEAPEYRPLLESQVANLFTEQILSTVKHTQELGTDPVGFSLYLRPRLHNTAELSSMDLTSLYQHADFSIHVSAKVRRPGLLWQTTPKKNS